MTPPPFEQTDENKRAFAAALVKFVGTPWDAAIHVFGEKYRGNAGVFLYVANEWVNDPLVVAEQQRLTAADVVGSTLANKDEAARQVWLWTQEPKSALKDRIEAMKLYAEMREFVKKDAPPPMPAMPPIVQYVLDPDAATAPNAAIAAAA